MGNMDIQCNSWTDKILTKLNLSIDFILIKLLCRFVNFEEMKKKYKKWF